MEQTKPVESVIADAAKFFGISEDEVRLMSDVSHNNRLILRINSIKSMVADNRQELLDTAQEELASYQKGLNEKYPGQVEFDQLGWAKAVKSANGKTDVKFVSQEEALDEVIGRISRYNFLLDQTTYSHNKEKLPELLSEMEELKKLLVETYGDFIKFTESGVPQIDIIGLEGDTLNPYPEGIDLNRNPDLNKGKDVSMVVTPIEPKTRYTVGEVIYGVCFFFHGAPPSYGFKYPYIFDNDEPTSIEIVQLTVTAHHKVPNVNGDQSVKDCDGFILTDQYGNTWYNQYPVAHYGQITTEADHRFNRHFKDKDHLQKLKNQKEVVSCHLLTDYYRNLVLGIREFEKEEVRAKATDMDELIKRHQTLVALQEKISAQFMLGCNRVLREREIWPGVEGAIEFYTAIPNSSAVLSVEHLQGGEETVAPATSDNEPKTCSDCTDYEISGNCSCPMVYINHEDNKCKTTADTPACGYFNQKK